MEKIRIVVADSHPLIRLGIKTAVAREPGMEVVAEVAEKRRMDAIPWKRLPEFLISLAIGGQQPAESLRRRRKVGCRLST